MQGAHHIREWVLLDVHKEKKREKDWSGSERKRESGRKVNQRGNQRKDYDEKDNVCPPPWRSILLFTL